MGRITDRIYYFVEQLFGRSALWQLVAVIGIIFLISLTGGFVVWGTSPAFDDFWASVWWAFLRLSDPGYLGDDEGLLARSVSTVLTVAGYVVFLGALVAIMTTWLNRFMGQLLSGRSPIFEKDHIVIVGWSSQLHAIIEEMVHAKERVAKRWRKRRLPAIVILAQDYRPELLAELEGQLAEDVRDECRVLIRTGNPLELASLERVDFARAAALVLLSPVKAADKKQLADVTLVKTLMTIKAHAEAIDPDARPTVVLQIANPANRLLAESVGWEERTEAVATDEIIARLLCQTLRQPGLSSVYNHLLTDTWGESLYLVSVDELGLEGRTLREVHRCFEIAVPIGFLKGRARAKQEQRLRILALDEPMEAGDEIIALSPTIRDIARGYDPDRALEPREPGRQRVTQPPGVGRKLLVLGWSRRLPALLRELGSYRREHFEIQIVAGLPEQDALRRLEPLVSSYAGLDLRYRQLVVDDPYDVDALTPESYDGIALLSSELAEDYLVADAESLMAHVLLAHHLRENGGDEKVSFLVELADEDNRELFELEGAEDLVMTNEIVSHLLSQVAVRPALAWIYEELFTVGGPEIRFRRFDEVMGELGELSFDDCQAACLAAGAVALGYRFRAERGDLRAGTHLNPHPDALFRPAPEDYLVIVEPQERPSYVD